ncbi:MAG: GH116 family glycosyl hydrolase, partial [Planctomycetota bacterium]
RIWPNVKRAMEYMIKADGNEDGMVEGAQANTLDAAWFGEISFLASLYLAALRACEAMATDMDDAEFAERCKAIADRGADKILETWNGEYFIQIEDPAHKEAIGTGPGCYIDQVYGQSWAHQVALGHLFDPEKQRRALSALYKYNFVPDVGPFREAFNRGRWYAVAGDAGLLMCTWPKGGQNPKFKDHWQYMYFNECMSGFEWQTASHMIMEGMLKEGLAIGRAIHDRYNAALRNPYNEIECSDHYARSMASYGSFIAASGFEYHGPKGHIGFRPRLSPQDFRSAFTSAEGWGHFAQKREKNQLKAELEVRWGSLKLKTIALEVEKGHKPNGASARAGSEKVPVNLALDNQRVTLTMDATLTIAKGEKLELEIS